MKKNIKEILRGTNWYVALGMIHMAVICIIAAALSGDWGFISAWLFIMGVPFVLGYLAGKQSGAERD